MAFHGYHHITSTVTSARGDVDVPRPGCWACATSSAPCCSTATRPFYHLYYGNEYGEPGTLLTSFAFGPERPGGAARLRPGQFHRAVGAGQGSLDFW